MRTILNALIRFLVIWLISTLAILATSWLMPGMHLNPVEGFGVWAVAAAVAFVLGLANLVVRPLILLLAMPLGFIALFVVGFFVNAIVLLLAANLLNPAFVVRGLLPAIAGSLLLSLATSLLMSLLNVDDDNSFYEGVIARRLGRQTVALPPDPPRGLVMLEIDGLSYFHIRQAIADGIMPNVKKLIERRGYVLSRTDCGLPSQTSACQAGILFGDNFDIPAFRWYDKSQSRLFVSGNDAALINNRYASGNGLLRGGASVNNMVNGDAMLSLLTASDLRGGTAEQKRSRARDVYTLLLNPNFFLRTIGLFLGEALLEVAQYAGDVVRGVEPRLNRLHKFYPLVRAATTVFMREVSGYLTLMQIVRGEPAMYTTWPGYDEVAHHSGPWSKHAFSTLRGFDRFIGTVLETIETKAPRPYEFLLLSDHGQSFGPTFLMRYGYTLQEFIERHMPAGTVVMQSAGGDDGSLSVIAMAAELGNIEDAGMGGRVGKATARRMKRAAEVAMAARRAQDAREAAAAPQSAVTFCGSGNLAQIYFHAFPQRATVSQLNDAYPGLIDAVVQHEGVGLLVVADDAGMPIVFGKGGARNLHTGEVTGEDPLAAYGDVAVRAWQLRRVADFPATGDMIAISTLYPDGTVAAMEELIGNHGGLGGEQTDSFLLHPADLELPAIRSATQLFDVLNARRELPAPAQSVATPAAGDDWSPANLARGLGRVRDWVSLALRAALLQRDAYREIAGRGDMTGPALLLALLGALGAAYAGHNFTTPAGFAFQTLIRLLFWPLTTLAVHAAARIARGQGTYTQTVRVLGFVQTVYLLGWLTDLPLLSNLLPPLTALLALIATWLGVAQAHRLRGWRTVAVPVLYLVVGLVGAVAAVGLFTGLDAALKILGARFGLLP